MASYLYGGMSELRGAASRRSADAWALYKKQHWCGAMYLLGYAVECRLKASLMDKVMPVKTRTIDKLQEILKPEFPDSLVDVTPSGIRDNIHIKVVSRRFDGMKLRQREEFLWGLIDVSDLSKKEKSRISLLLPLSPDDL